MGMACAGQSPSSAPIGDPDVELRLSAGSDAPALFLGPEPDAPVVGFLGPDVLVEIAGASDGGRVPVRIRGALWTRGFVPEELLVLRVQRAGRLRGAPVFLGPNDMVNVVGKGEKEGRLQVRAVPRVAGKPLAVAFEGSYPSVGLAAQRAPGAALEPRGEAYELPAQSALVLYDKPRGEKLFELPASPTPVPLRVLSSANGWAAVRVGDGPYLIGYTSAALSRVEEAAPAAAAVDPGTGAVPTRLAKEGGVLKRVAAGARVHFGDRVIARLHDPGLARVLTTYSSGEVDA
ncbi:MAG TPA: hypothetical protein VFZ61_06885, partial [Polyangiales bacterium]